MPPQPFIYFSGNWVVNRYTVPRISLENHFHSF
jgi:hypothetical protein